MARENWMMLELVLFLVWASFTSRQGGRDAKRSVSTAWLQTMTHQQSIVVALYHNCCGFDSCTDDSCLQGFLNSPKTSSWFWQQIYPAVWSPFKSYVGRSAGKCLKTSECLVSWAANRCVTRYINRTWKPFLTWIMVFVTQAHMSPQEW